MRAFVYSALLVVGCQSVETGKPAGTSTPKRHDVTTALGSALRVAIGDVDGDRSREIVAADAQALRVLDAAGAQLASTPVSGGIQVLVTADIDGDGKDEILAGWGMTREHRDAKARITLHRFAGGALTEEVIVEPETTRPDIAAIVPMLDERAVLVAYFDAKYTVTSAVAHRAEQGWQLAPIASIRMATSYARGDIDGDGEPELVVGRAYGDDLGKDGDAFVLAADGTRTPLPTTRGLRSLAIVGRDVFMGDGWHQNYGKNARGLVTRITKAGSAFRGELVEDTPGQYAIERIVPATLGGEPAIVTLGSNYVRVYAKRNDAWRGDSWRGLTISGHARDVAVGDLDGKPGDEILIVGDKGAEIVDLAGVTW